MFRAKHAAGVTMAEKPTAPGATPVDLEQLVAEADTGGRKPLGLMARVIVVVAIAWSLFQLWYASPLPFMVGFGTSRHRARAFHLSFALFCVTCYPAFASSPRARVPSRPCACPGGDRCVLTRRVLRELVLRPGLPTLADIACRWSGSSC